MKVLFCKTFGLGNAVMAVPAIKALVSMGHLVDVLVGSTPDDVGALEIFGTMRHHGIAARHIWVDRVPLGFVYDLAILSIPFDGRWQNGLHFHADRVVDGRTRPDPSTTGLVSWKKHEVEYQMENVRDLGYVGPVPDCSFRPKEEWALRPRVFYLGVGYKKDAAGFWKKKHWGNENYARLVKMILDDHPTNLVCTSGDMADLQLSIRPIMSLVNDPKRFVYRPGGIRESIATVARCGVYFGNDTGMMHVAAACGRKVVGLFFLENSITKSRPWCDRYVAVDGVGRTVDPEEVFKEINEVGPECPY